MSELYQILGDVLKRDLFCEIMLPHVYTKTSNMDVELRDFLIKHRQRGLIEKEKKHTLTEMQGAIASVLEAISHERGIILREEPERLTSVSEDIAASLVALGVHPNNVGESGVWKARKLPGKQIGLKASFKRGRRMAPVDLKIKMDPRNDKYTFSVKSRNKGLR